MPSPGQFVKLAFVVSEYTLQGIKMFPEFPEHLYHIHKICVWLFYYITKYYTDIWITIVIANLSEIYSQQKTSWLDWRNGAVIPIVFEVIYIYACTPVHHHPLWPQ